MHTALLWVEYLTDAISSFVLPEHIPILRSAYVASRGRDLGMLHQRFLAMTGPALVVRYDSPAFRERYVSESYI
jgi:hypothetical protein